MVGSIVNLVLGDPGYAQAASLSGESGNRFQLLQSVFFLRPPISDLHVQHESGESQLRNRRIRFTRAALSPCSTTDAVSVAVTNDIGRGSTEMKSERDRCRCPYSLQMRRHGHRHQQSQPLRAALIAAISIFFMVIIAVNTRLRTAGSLSLMPSVSAAGVICHDKPHLSLHQPH